MKGFVFAEQRWAEDLCFVNKCEKTVADQDRRHSFPLLPEPQRVQNVVGFF